MKQPLNVHRSISAAQRIPDVRLPLDVRAIRRHVIDWYRENGRDLPWRHTTDPYAVLVSEFMLQQTQVTTVLPYFARWMERFPDFATLAAAEESAVLRTWEGLGYYSRARNLHRTAQLIAERHGGQYPRRPSASRLLPGLGEYTANAVATFAFNQSVPIVETNIARLLARLTNMREPLGSAAARKELWRTASALVPSRNARAHNSALMDLGALVCKREPQCRVCPLQAICRAPDPQNLPTKPARRATVSLVEHHVFRFSRGRVLLQQAVRRWRGMWVMPARHDPNLDQSPIYTGQFAFTHHRITLMVHGDALQRRRSKSEKWFRAYELVSLPIAPPHRRAIDYLLQTSVHKPIAAVSPQPTFVVP